MSDGVGGVSPRLCNSPFRESFLNGMIILQDEQLLQASNQLFFKGDIEIFGRMTDTPCR